MFTLTILIRPSLKKMIRPVYVIGRFKFIFIHFDVG